MKILPRLFFIFAFLAIFFLIVAYSRGYRLDIKEKSFTPTGILAITSLPKAAKIYINNELKGATDSNITLPPGEYTVEVKKEGYTGWKKTVNLKGEWVLSLNAVLFPLNPSLSPLTNLGIIRAIAIDNTDKILIFSENNNLEKDGIYLFEGSQTPLPILPPLKLILAKKNLPENIDFKKAEVTFSPDYKEVIIDLKTIDNFYPQANFSYLLSLDEENKNPLDITTSKQALIDAWEKEKLAIKLKLLNAYPKELAKIASDSFHIISFSPDETKILYQAKKTINLPAIITPPLIAVNQTEETRQLKKDSIYVYDKKEDKNYLINIFPKNINQLNESLVQWLPDSKHLIFLETKKIAVVDYDGTNKQTVYSGPFESLFFKVNSDSRLIILTNLNPETNPLPDLYAVGIK